MNFSPVQITKSVVDGTIRKIKVIILSVLETFFQNYVFTIRRGLAKGFKRRYGFGFRPKFVLTKDEKFLIDIDLINKVVYDIGSYIGIYALFFSRAVGEHGKVFTFEPNPKNYDELVFNLQLNRISNVETKNIGLGQKEEKTDLVINPVFPARGKISRELNTGKSSSSRRKIIKIQVNSFDDILQKESLPNPDFIKIDVEGFELEVLRGMKNTLAGYYPELYIEIHGVLSKEMIQFLYSHGYTIDHIESGTYKIKLNGSEIKGGHIYCRFETNGFG